MSKYKKHAIVLLYVVMSFAFALQVAAQVPQQPPKPQPYVIESYYKIKWGYFDEFLDLYKKYHAPILKAAVERGYMIESKAAFPTLHLPEACRWDMRVTQVFPDRSKTGLIGPQFEALTKELYGKDWKGFKAGEQRRWELVLEHSDITPRFEDVTSW